MESIGANNGRSLKLIVYYQTIYSHRKTLALQIKEGGGLVIRSPYGLSDEMIADFVAQKQNWINKKQAQAMPLINIQYRDGCLLLYLGQFYPMVLNNDSQVVFENGLFFVPQSHPHQALLNWYKNTFRKIALPRLKYYGQKHHLLFNQVRLKAQKTRWGSCSANNNINLNYLLIQAPIVIIDYVILHELSHIKHKNHSKEFYQYLHQLMPNYSQANQWLKQFGYLKPLH